MIVFDIETGPLAEEEIIERFDPSSVKTGNLKDPAKVEAKIEGARQKFLDDAALSPLTGQVLAIGYGHDEGRNLLNVLDENTSEHVLVSEFWKYWLHSAEDFIGFNIHAFDLPFLARRSWLLGVDVPSQAFNGRYWSSNFIDLLEVWRCGNRQDYAGLADIDQALGGPGKPKGTSGADFARLLFGSKKQKKQALDYLDNDLEMARRVAEALQVL